MKNALLEKSEIISCKEKIKGNSKKMIFVRPTHAYENKQES